MGMNYDKEKDKLVCCAIRTGTSELLAQPAHFTAVPLGKLMECVPCNIMYPPICNKLYSM